MVFAAATMGTHKLLHKMKDQGVLPNLSDRLGLLTRTNSEALLGAIALNRDIDYTEGVAITSSFHPNDHTHVEPVRYGRGSNAMAVLIGALVPGDLPGSRVWRWVKETCRMLVQLRGNVFKVWDPFHWSEKTVIALVMQTHDNSITTSSAQVVAARRQEHHVQAGARRQEPDYIPEATRPCSRMAEVMGGKGKAIAGGTIGEPFGIPMTAHFMGGAVIGDSPETGVIDPYHRVYGHPGLHVVDGAAISANLGVNPSLTISAQAERALVSGRTRASSTRVPSSDRPTAASRQWPRSPRSSRTTRPLPIGFPSSSQPASMWDMSP